MKPILFINDNYPIRTRSRKIGESLERISPSYEVVQVAWDRNTEASIEKQKNMAIYQSKTGYGKRFKKAFDLFGYFLFVRKLVKTHQPEIIVCRHWDMFFISVFANKSLPIVYDVCDIPHINGGKFDCLITWLEHRLIMWRKPAVILASRFFEPIYEPLTKSVITMENRIDFSNKITLSTKKSFNNSISIAFIGAVRYFDTLVTLVNAAIKTDSTLNIYGDGPDLIKLKEYTADFSNIHFFGSYPYDKINQFYADNDLIWAAYPFKSENVKLAISNKFFESLYFEKPAIFSDNTQLGKHVAEHGIGYTVNPYDIKSVIEVINHYQKHKDEDSDKIRRIKLYKINNSIDWKSYDHVLNDFMKKYTLYT